jgi:hypothetical protein
MADISQLLATYDALVGVALGAGLTYGFGALNRRHQEAREDKTRWYETRLKAYGEIGQTFLNMALLMEQSTRSYAELREARERAVAELRRLAGTIHLVGSPEVVNEVERLLQIALEGLRDVSAGRRVDAARWGELVDEFAVAARKTSATQALDSSCNGR